MNAKTSISKPAKRVKAVTKNQIWKTDKLNTVRSFILAESKKQTAERKLRNELLAIQYLMQDYIAHEKVNQEMRILDFVKLYLKLLKITQKNLATGFEMNDTNLYKYLTGERKLNPDIVLKLSSFSHTPPELWYRIQIKNELLELSKEKEKMKQYKKYDYRKLVAAYA